MGGGVIPTSLQNGMRPKRQVSSGEGLAGSSAPVTSHKGLAKLRRHGLEAYSGLNDMHCTSSPDGIVAIACCHCAPLFDIRVTAVLFVEIPAPVSEVIQDTIPTPQSCRIR